MKKILLHFHRYIVVTRLFNLNFVGRYIKGGYTWNKVDQQNILFVQTSNSFLLQTNLEEVSQLSKIVPKKGKTLFN